MSTISAIKPHLYRGAVAFLTIAKITVVDAVKYVAKNAFAAYQEAVKCLAIESIKAGFYVARTVEKFVFDTRRAFFDGLHAFAAIVNDIPGAVRELAIRAGFAALESGLTFAVEFPDRAMAALKQYGPDVAYRLGVVTFRTAVGLYKVWARICDPLVDSVDHKIYRLALEAQRAEMSGTSSYRQRIGKRVYEAMHGKLPPLLPAPSQSWWQTALHWARLV